MKALKNEMIAEAKERFGDDILPCGRCESLNDCFTEWDTELVLWFNVVVDDTSNETTKIITRNIPN